MVLAQRQWACAAVALEKVHSGSQVAASAVLEGGAPTEELGACVPTHAGGRRRMPHCAGVAPCESGGVRLEDAARPIQTIGRDTEDKVRTVLGKFLWTNSKPQASPSLKHLSYPKGSYSRRKTVQDQHHVPWEERARPMRPHPASIRLAAESRTPTPGLCSSSQHFTSGH